MQLTGESGSGGIRRFSLLVLVAAIAFANQTSFEPGVTKADGHEITLHGQYYDDKGSTVLIPGIDVSINAWEGGTVSASASVDAISSASEYRASELDAVSSASEYEDRIQGTLGVSQELGMWSFDVGGYYSTEPDYTSMALSAGFSRDFRQRTTTLSFAFNYGTDDISSSENDAFNETANRYGVAAALTQVFSPILVGRFTLGYSDVTGFQASPYRSALRGAGAPEYDNREVLPEDRQRYSFHTQLNIYLKGVKGALHPGYRLYTDNWGIMSHTFELNYYQYLTPYLIMRLDTRYYTQTEADYYKEAWYGPEEYMTSYAKYARSNGYLGQLELRYNFHTKRNGALGRFVNGMSFFGSGGYYYRTADSNGGVIGQFGISWKW